MKRLFEFTLNKEIEKENQVENVNEKGEKVITIQKVKQNLPQKFFIRKPNRELADDADLFFGVELADGVKKGLLTRAMLAKRYGNDDGIFSETERQSFETLRKEAFEKEAAFQRLDIKGTERNSEENEQYNQVLLDLTRIQNKLQEYQLAQESLFSQTAETRARNKTILWWVLNISYSENNQPLCGDGTYKERLAKYDTIVEGDDDILKLALKRFSFYISFWYIGRAENEEDFKSLEQIYTDSETSEATFKQA